MTNDDLSACIDVQRISLLADQDLLHRGVGRLLNTKFHCLLMLVERTRPDPPQLHGLHHHAQSLECKGVPDGHNACGRPDGENGRRPCDCSDASLLFLCLSLLLP